MPSMLRQLILLFGVLPLCIYESIRFYLLFGNCSQLHAENSLLLMSESCNDYNRRAFAKKDAMCRAAEEEHRLPPMTCAWHRMWGEGEPLRVWRMFTQSHWMLWGSLVPVACFVIFMMFASRNQRLRDERMLTFQEKMYKDTLAVVGGEAPFKKETVPSIELAGGRGHLLSKKKR